MASDALRFRCNACSARFAKMDHLNRHQLSHDVSRGYECHFCSARFHRRDALLRHWKTCGQRLNAGLPEPTLPAKKAGRKPNACSRCAQLKKKCSGRTPCGTCWKQGLECNYPRSSPYTPAPTSDAPTPAHKQRKSSSAATVCGASGEEPEFFRHFQPSFQSDVHTLLLSLCEQSSDPLSPALHSLPPDASPYSLQSHPVIFPSIPHVGPFELNPNSISMTELTWSPFPRTPLLAPLTPSPIFQTSNLRFLARLTSTHGMARSFECDDAISKNEMVPSFGPATPRLEIGEWYHDATLEPNTAYWFDFGSPDAFAGESPTADSDAVNLVPKAGEIVRGIRSIVNKDAPVDWPESRERACRCFFSPARLDRFIRTFFHVWHPNWPVFHTPTFDAAEKPPRLVAAMALIGACLSPEGSDRDRAMAWVDAVEEWVFSNPDLCETPISRTGDRSELASVEARLDALRAAYAVVLVLAWEGCEDQMARARRMRFSQVICVSRSLYHFASGQRNRSIRDDSLGPWRLFALREECTRLLSYVFLLDSAFVMFNHTAPRMITSELQFSLASPDSCFEAPDVDTWTRRMAKWETDGFPPRMTLSEAIDILIRGESDSMELRGLEKTGLLNLFALISAVHNIIFHHHNGPDYTERSASISRALRNWARVWGGREATETNPDYDTPDLLDWPAPVGFIKYAREYWSLAVIVYNQSEYTYNSKVDRQFGEACGGRLKKFDSSDMGQVHELIVRFQDVDLSQALM